MSQIRLCDLLYAAAAYLILAAMPCQAAVATAVQSVSVSIAAQGRLYFPASATLTRTGGPFTPYSGPLAFTYRVRTTSSGSATVTVQASGDFTPAGGPSLASGALTYTCSSDGYASPCTGTQTVSTSTQRPVLNLGAGACTGGGSGCSSNDPAAGTAQFRLGNDTVVPTGNYSVQLVFTISCT